MYLVNGTHLINHLPDLGPNDSYIKVDLADLLQQLPESELKRIYGSIGGKLGKRRITPDQQAKMQEARKRKA